MQAPITHLSVKAMNAGRTFQLSFGYLFIQLIHKKTTTLRDSSAEWRTKKTRGLNCFCHRDKVLPLRWAH